ncbi:MAG: sodium:solute symporter [Lachnospiraceae bacterium]|nr:sodium:solute symporter [Lachnospiraceae bacterium]
MKSLQKGKMWLFAVGQLGWAILSGLISNWLVYFYQPDETAVAAGQKLLLPQGLVILGIFTVIGGVTALGRVFDAVTDPWIASLSDKCTSKNGRRIPFLKWASLPLAIATVLVFCAPVPKVSSLNAVWVFVFVMLYYLCITAYCTPYAALIPELGHDQKERLNISTAISLTFIVGTAFAYAAPVVWGLFEDSLGRMAAMRLTFAIFAAVAFICMMVPVFAIREKDYVNSTPAKGTALSSLIKTFRNRDFRVFVGSDILYWIALTMFQTGLPFFVTSLLCLKESMSTVYFVAMTALSLVFYVPINMLARKIGKKKIVFTAFLLFALSYLYTSFLGNAIPISPVVQGFVLVVAAAIPMAVFGILPQAMVADVAESDAYQTGENREGMFYAARTFAFKLGQSVAMLLFTAIAASSGNGALAYRQIAGTASVFCLLGGVVLLCYNEKKVTEHLR